MADEAGNIYVKLGLDEKEFYAGLDHAQEGLVKLSERINESGERIDTMTKMSGGKLGRMGQQVAEVGKDIEKAWSMVEPLANANQSALEQLRAEYDRLGKAASEAFMAGDDQQYFKLKEYQSELGGMMAMYRDVGREIDAVTQKLMEEESQYQIITRKIEDANNAHSSLRTQLMHVRSEMQEMLMAARESGGEVEVAAVKGSEAYRQLQEKARDLGITINEVNKETQMLASNTAGLQGMVAGLQGVVGGFSAVQGALAVFGTKSEDLQKVQTRVQGCIAAMMGLQQVMKTLQKNSAFMLMLSKLKTAFIGVSVGANTATVSVRALWAALRANPLGLILTALTAAVSIIGIFVKKQKEQKEKMEEAKKAAEEFKERVMELGSSPIVQIKKLQSQWAKVGDSFSEKKAFIEKNKKAFDELGVAIHTVADAENLLVRNTDAFVRAQIQRAIAASFDEDIMKAAKEYVKAKEAYDQAATRYSTSQKAMLEDIQANMGNPAYQDYDAMHTPLSVRMFEDARRQFQLDEEAYKEADKKLNDLIAKQSDAAKAAAEILQGADIETTEDDDAKERLKRLAEQQRKLRQAYEQSLETYRRNAAKQERQTLWDTEQISIDMMADGLRKTLRQLKLNHDQEMARIEEQEEEKIEQWRQLKAKEWAAQHPKADEEANPYARKEVNVSLLTDKEKEEYEEGVADIYNAMATVRDNENARWQQSEREAMRKVLGENQSYVAQRIALERQYQSDRAALVEKGASEAQLHLFDEAYRAKQKELFTELLGDYAGFQQQMNEMAEEFGRRRAELEAALATEQDPKKRKAIQASLKEIEKQYAQTAKNIQQEFIKNNIGDVFNEQTVANIKAAKEELDKMEAMSLDDFNLAYSAHLSAEEFENLKQQIRKVRNELRDMGKGYTLKEAFSDAFSGKSKEEVERGVDYLVGGMQKVSSLVGGLAGAMREFADATNNAHLEKMADTFQDIADTISTAGGYAAAGAQIGGGWGALIGAVLGIGQGVLTSIFKSEAAEKAAYQARVDESISYMSEILSGINNINESVKSMAGTITGLDYKNYASAMLEFFNTLNENQFNTARSAWSWRDSMNRNGYGITPAGNGMWGALYTDANPASLPYQLQAYYIAAAMRLREMMYTDLGGTGNYIFGDEIPNISSRLFNTIFDAALQAIGDSVNHSDFTRSNPDYSIANGIAWAIAGYIQQQYGQLEALKKEFEEAYWDNSFDSTALFNLNNQALQINKNIYEAQYMAYLLAGDEEKAAEALRNIREIQYQMTESLRNMFESLAGSDFQSIVNNWLDIFKEFGNNFEAAIAKINESINDMIRNMVVQTVFVQPLMQRLNKYLQDYAENANLETDELGNYIWTNEAFRGLAEGLRTQVEGAKELYQQLMGELNAAGLGWDDPNSRSASARGIAQASQESIDELNGNVTGIHREVFSINESTTLIQQNVAAMLGSVRHIETNTEELHSIRSAISDIQTRGVLIRS